MVNRIPPMVRAKGIMEERTEPLYDSSMKTKGFLLSACLFVSGILAGQDVRAASFFGGSSQCSVRNPPRILVQGIPFTTILDHSTSVEDLTAIGPPRLNSLGVGVAYTQGLVVAQLASTTDYGMISEQLPDGSWCTRAETVKIMFGAPTPATVHVASQYPLGSCAYAAVLEHELKHVSMYRRVIATMQPWLQQNVPSVAVPAASAAGPTAQASQDAFVAKMKAAVDPLIAYAHSYADGWSKSVDTPQEYARVHSLCTEWYENTIDIHRISAAEGR
jgi:hypothetical protein